MEHNSAAKWPRQTLCYRLLQAVVVIDATMPCRPRALNTIRNSRQFDRLSRLASSNAQDLVAALSVDPDSDENRLALDDAVNANLGTLS